MMRIVARMSIQKAKGVRRGEKAGRKRTMSMVKVRQSRQAAKSRCLDMTARV